MKKCVILILVFSGYMARAQKIDSIFVNLYTDSLKKGTFNYINVDGLFSDGTYLPLDSTDIIFTTTAGKFYGNSLWIDKETATKKVRIKAVLRSKPVLCKDFEIYIKQQEDNEKLLTNEELLDKLKRDARKQNN